MKKILSSAFILSLVVALTACGQTVQKEKTEFLPQVDTVPSLVQNEIHPYYQENDVISGSSNPDHIFSD